MSDNASITAALSDHESATAKEICQQPAVWRAVQASVQARRNAIDDFLRPLLVRRGLRIVFTGAGTSAFAGQMLASILTTRLEAAVEARASTDIVARPKECFAGKAPLLLVSIARSGNSPESIAAARLAEQCATDYHHLILTCNDQGKLYQTYRGASRALVLMMPPETDDQGFAMTSSLTSMMWAALCSFMPEQATEQRTEQIAQAAEHALSDDADRIRRFAQAGFTRITYLGSGPMRGLAREAALKMLELTAGEVLAYFDTSLGFRHGPKALVNDSTRIVVFISNDRYARRYDEDIVAELVSQYGRESVVAVAASGSDAVKGAPLWLVDDLEDEPDWLLVLPYLVEAQLLAFYTSLARDKNVDNPFPSGEVNRVVQGVTIHPFDGSAR